MRSLQGRDFQSKPLQKLRDDEWPMRYDSGGDSLSFADVAAPKCEARSRFEESAKVGAASALFLCMESAWFSSEVGASKEAQNVYLRYLKVMAEDLGSGTSKTIHESNRW